ncbi:MAG: glycosyltransferase family 92 protein [Proteobacteria bacterium]|nr:glycosyltransferase family 92 protein [Candidatus Enterousia scatequi]
MNKIAPYRKFIASLLTFWIPIKKYRRALRGIFMIGVFNYLHIVKQDKVYKFKNTLSIGAIMKDEGPYLKEWLDFHILVGVDKFYLYDNGSTDNTVDILAPYIERGVVEYTNFPGKTMQLLAYIDCINKHKTDTRWIALIDLDEFIVPVQHKTIPEFLYTLPLNFAQLVIAWIIYGSSGHKTKPDGLVIENFKYHAKKSWGIKSIINPRLVIEMTNPHANLVAGSTIDETGKRRGKIDQDKNPPTCNKVRINHYVTKSYEEMMKRCAKGDACEKDLNNSGKTNAQRRFEFHDKNDVFDTIMDKYINKIKKM